MRARRDIELHAELCLEERDDCMTPRPCETLTCHIEAKVRPVELRRVLRSTALLFDVFLGSICLLKLRALSKVTQKMFQT